MNKQPATPFGRVTAVRGPVLDIAFTGALPDLLEAVLVHNDETPILTEVQAQAILHLRLARLTGLERQKIEDEYRELIARIAELKAILDSRDLVLQPGATANLGTSAAFETGSHRYVMWLALVPHAPTSGWVRLYEGNHSFLGMGEIL